MVEANNGSDKAPPATSESQPGEVQPALSTRGLVKYFGALTAVANVNLDLKPGETLALVGPNGAGKTTTLRLLATLLPPDGGTIAIMGKSARDPFPVRHFIGYMPDVLGVYPEMLVGEYLEFFARAYEIKDHLIGYCIRETAAFTGLEKLLDAPAAGLSRGMLQRVSLARALLHDPPVLLLDEPAAGLDPHSRAEFRHILMGLRNRGKAVIISSHILSDLEETCSAIALMDRGRIRLIEGMGDFLKRAGSTRTFRVTSGKEHEKMFALMSGRKDISGLRWDGETLMFEMAKENGNAAGVLRSLVLEGIEVDGFTEIPLSLEKAYLAHTSGENPEKAQVQP